jgi:hypothetical protein
MATAEDIIREKEFPTNYPADALKVITTLSFTGNKNLNLVGSQSLRSQQYAGDYDCYNEVKLTGSKPAALKKLVAKFKSVVSALKSIKNCFVGDIKAGLVPEWEVLTDSTYKATAAKQRLKKLLDAKIITQYEYDDAAAFLKPKLSYGQYLIAKNNIKFHIVRWTPALVKAGKQTLRDGRVMTLEEAIQSPSIVKIDAIAMVAGNRFSEFSCIYSFVLNGKPLNPSKIDIKGSLDEAIEAYTAEGKLFKVLKRKFSLAKLTNDKKTLERLNPILTGDLGRLYVIQSDMAVLLSLLEYRDAPIKAIKAEMDEFVNRFANIYTIPAFQKIEPKLIEDITTALKFKSKARLIARLKVINEEIEKVLNNSTARVIKGGKRCNYRPVIR